MKDPQIQHNKMIVTTDHPTLGPVDVTGVPIRFYDTPGSIRRHPPLLGEHTREILEEWDTAPRTSMHSPPKGSWRIMRKSCA